MFERYNIDELYIGFVSVIYPDKMFFPSDTDNGYTVLRKIDEEHYIDLQNPSIKFSTAKQNPQHMSYVIDHIEPLSRYYTQDGNKIESLSKRKAIIEGRKHYNAVNNNYIKSIIDQNAS